MKVCPCAFFFSITFSGLDTPGNRVSALQPLCKVVAKGTHFTSSWREELDLLFHRCITSDVVGGVSLVGEPENVGHPSVISQGFYFPPLKLYVIMPAWQTLQRVSGEAKR